MSSHYTPGLVAQQGVDMPTNRQRLRHGRLPDVEDWQLCFLLDRDIPEEVDSGARWFMESNFEDIRKEMWRAFEAELLAEFIADLPGRRPRAWWDYSAPKMPEDELERHGWLETFFAADLVEPRQRLGGVGLAMFEQFPSHVPEYELGLPKHWHSIDPDDPPRFESQAAYLRRHDLFLPGEEQRLTSKHFQPEKIAVP